MNGWLAAAGALLIGVGAVHSSLGERLVFRRLRGRGCIPTEGGGRLREGHLRILWATWHVASVQAAGAAAVLLYASKAVVAPAILLALLATAAGSGLLVLVGTRGRHPGWVGLSLAALLIGIGLP